MTEITKLLDTKAKQEFNDLVYEDGGLLELLPAGLTFDDTAKECIAVLIILEQIFDLERIGKSKLYGMYIATLGFISQEYSDTYTSGDCFTKKSFFKFMNLFFPGWGCKKALE